MNSRAILERLKALQQELSHAPTAACRNHVRLCPTGDPSGAWRDTAHLVADMYRARHGVDFLTLPCETGDTDEAEQLLHQAGVLDVPTPRGPLLYLIPNVDLLEL
ncbi:hypothetical protein DFP74_5783 [Nocardiopsis sp. Huas11]|uniref:hypothetical protein n=1 Tax=Nocardiopsis sp. Huas11 TaxID=2183912 RepID=UPI000EAD4918|nr:hypothetical protein [Nocardiopsis sp. Huas11]RKS10037.1 hypothetical protein DFP74_5783 [Nocardiopsis sp. Huas11]